MRPLHTTGYSCRFRRELIAFWCEIQPQPLHAVPGVEARFDDELAAPIKCTSYGSQWVQVLVSACVQSNLGMVQNRHGTEMGCNKQFSGAEH